MTFVLRNRIPSLNPFGGGVLASLSDISTSNELYRVARGGLFSLMMPHDEEAPAAGPRPELLDLHACRRMLKAWAASATHEKQADGLLPKQPFVLVPGYERVTAQQNAMSYACLATLLDVHLHSNLIDICAAYGDIEPPYKVAIAAEAATTAAARAAAVASGDLGLCPCCGGAKSLNNTALRKARNPKRLRPVDASTSLEDRLCAETKGVKRVRLTLL
jgi:hypothetical protein